MPKVYVTIDGNEAAASIAHSVSEVIAIYPITPSSPMGEFADEWSAKGIPNVWGTIPKVVELQSEGGASGAVHGATQTGALTTTFTAAQGLLLMIPNMHKIAGELTPTVFHVSARTLATHALSIFGDHSDVMDCRATGFALIASGSVQEAQDMAMIAHSSTIKARVPFLHFFDGFRTSHEVQKIEKISKETILKMMDFEAILNHRKRALNPENPVLRGTAQNPDHFFQARERINPYYNNCPKIVQEVMDQFYELEGRRYNLFDYYGSSDAEYLIVIMGSGAECAEETVQYLQEKGEKVGLIKVRLYRPFSIEHFLKTIPSSTKKIAVLDRTKEPGAEGEPLYLDVVSAIYYGIKNNLCKLNSIPDIYGGRYGLSSKEFTPAMVKGIFDAMKENKIKHSFTVGIEDDVTKTSIFYDKEFSIDHSDFRGLFFGLGADGTVSANKNSIKIIGEETENWAQGYFVYDSRKAGTLTVSHLRFGKKPIKATYLVQKANFIACHQFVFLEKYDILKYAEKGATFLVNSPYGREEFWDKIPRKVQEQIIDKEIKVFIIDAYEVAKKTGMGRMINTIMQTCFFAISNIIPKMDAIAKIKSAIEKTYGKKGEKIVKMNFQAVDQTLANLHQLNYPKEVTSKIEMQKPVPDAAPEFVRNVVAKIIEGRGDEVKVSEMPVDGTFETGTTQYEKRNIALEIPVWEPSICIQCAKCSFVCPHATLRIKVYDPSYLNNAPKTFKSMDYIAPEYKGKKYTIQVAPEDCTGCGLCVEVCPAKDKKNPQMKALRMEPQIPLREDERENWNFFLSLPDVDRNTVKINTIKGSQFLRPLFEFSGACAGCGETPYIKLLTQLFGDRAIIANATGCSSIYGGNLPTIPYCKDEKGRGPAWNNSLFEDNAEFGYGFRLTINKHREYATELLLKFKDRIPENLIKGLLEAKQESEAEINSQRERVSELKNYLKNLNDIDSKNLLSICDSFVKRSVWIVGGDGWAYDIGYGGLDHVIASGADVNLLVLDTGVYSNTGGQMSKATPKGAVAKFAFGGKPAPRKDLGLMAIAYGNVYVAKVAFGANDLQTLKAFLEAENYNGPSLIIAYSHCIAHGIDMSKGLLQQKKAVDSGSWILYRFNPLLKEKGEKALIIDSKEPSIALEEYYYSETRFSMLKKSNPERARILLEEAKKEVEYNWKFYTQLSQIL